MKNNKTEIEKIYFETLIQLLSWASNDGISKSPILFDSNPNLSELNRNMQIRNVLRNLYLLAEYWKINDKEWFKRNWVNENGYLYPIHLWSMFLGHPENKENEDKFYTWINKNAKNRDRFLNSQNLICKFLFEIGKKFRFLNAISSPDMGGVIQIVAKSTLGLDYLNKHTNFCVKHDKK